MTALEVGLYQPPSNTLIPEVPGVPGPGTWTCFRLVRVVVNSGEDISCNELSYS